MTILGIKLGYFFIAAGAAVIWVLLREFNCWYWKVNDRLIIMEEILARLERLEGQDQVQQPPQQPRSRFPEINID
jgi:hypothetical protein